MKNTANQSVAKRPEKSREFLTSNGYHWQGNTTDEAARGETMTPRVQWLLIGATFTLGVSLAFLAIR